MKTFFAGILFLFLILLGFTASLPEYAPSGWIVYIFLLGGAFFFKNSPGFAWIFTFLAVFLSARYWFFRTLHTMSFDHWSNYLLALPLYIAETFTLFMFTMTNFIALDPLSRAGVPLETEPDADIFVPSYNEDISIIKTTLIACSQIDYPAHKRHIYFLDDGATLEKQNSPFPQAARERYAELKSLCDKLGITYLTREKNENAKAGNINAAFYGNSFTNVIYENGLAKAGQKVNTNGKYILMLDCDHVPARAILKETLGFLEKDENLFLVQTPHFFYNSNSIEKNLHLTGRYPSENDMFYFRILKGLDRQESAFFCGSAGVLRREHLQEAGGFSHHSITEDTATSLTLHSLGYKSAYYAKPLTAGLAAETMSSFITQRMRWAQGSVQILMLKNIFLRRGLKLKQRLCYLVSFAYWFFSFSLIIYLLAPLLFLLFGFKIYNANASQILFYLVPFFFTALLLAKFNFGKLRPPFYSQVLEMILCVYVAGAAFMALLNPFKPKFKVTPKGEITDRSHISPVAKTFLWICGAYVVIFVLNAWRHAARPEALAIVGFWYLYNAAAIFAALGAFRERKTERDSAYFAAAGSYILESKGQKFNVKLKELNKEGFIADIDGADLDGGVLDGGINVTLAFDGKEYEGKFVINNLEDEKAVTAFIFGDGARWQYLADYRQSHGQGIWSSIFFLLKNAARGVKEGFKIIRSN